MRPGWANLRAWWAKIRPERALIANGGRDGRTVGRMEGHLEIHPSYRTSAAAQKGVSISFSLDMSLSDPKNKQKFIDFLGTKLTNQGCQVFYDKADADLLIVQKIIKSATSMNTVLIGEDTDLLSLLIHHMPSHSKEILFASDLKKDTKGRIWNMRGQNKIRHFSMQTHTFFTCIARMRHNILVIWYKKRVHFEKIQRK